MAKLNDEQKELLSAYMKTEDGQAKAVAFFVCVTSGMVLVSIGVGVMFGKAYGLLLAGVLLLLNGLLIVRSVKKAAIAND